MTRVAVIGAGSWGTAVAAITTRNADTMLWARRPELADAITSTHRNPNYLADYVLPESLVATSSLAEALDGAGVVVMGVPSHGFRSVLEEAAPFVAGDAQIISLTKGVEQGSLKRMTEVVADLLPNAAGVLTGPNLA